MRSSGRDASDPIRQGDSSRPKKVCMVAYTEYSTDARVRREAEAVAELPDFKVRVLCLKEGQQAHTWEKNKVTVEELAQEKYSGVNQFRYILSYIRFMTLTFLRLTALFLQRELNVVHIHNMPDFLVLSALIPRLFGAKLVLDIHDTMPETYEATFSSRNLRLLRPVLRRLLALEETFSSLLAHRVICVNEPQRRTVVGRGVPQTKTFVSMNVPDPTVFGDSCELHFTDPRPGSFRLVYHGTIASRLNIDLAVRAVAELRDKVPGLELNIIGDGSGVKELQAVSESFGLQGVIRFHGKKSLEEIVTLLKGMHLGVVPNDRNPATELMLPVKMMECMALGVPVIVPKLFTIKWYFPEAAVTYFEPGDFKSLALGILDLYMNPEKRERKAKAAREVLRQYGWENHKTGLLGLYQELVQ